jgi:hypothetical protein
MQSSFKIVSENRDRRFVTVREIAGLKISKSLYQPGYWFVTEFHEPTPVNNLSSKHFITSGKITDKSGLLPDRVAGWRTWEDTGVVPAGTIERESLKGCEIWCVWNSAVPGGRVDHVEVVFLTAGEEYTVPDQSNMFPAFGLLSLNGQPLEDETPYVLKNGERVVSAETDAYFMHWPINEATG